MTDQIWACEETALRQYLEAELNADLSALDLSAFSPQKSSIMSINGDTATIKINGILSRAGLSPLAQLLGFQGTSYNDIRSAVEELSDNAGVSTVRLEFDTPGGEVSGVDNVWSAVRMLAGCGKRVVAINNGLLASAGYWIASAADSIVATTPTAMTGSIGVVITQIDTSKRDEKAGIKRIRIVSRNAPNKIEDATTEDGRKSLQDRADAIERVFFSRIAEGRRLPLETIKKDFGRGSVMIAKDPDDDMDDALSVGMIDGVDNRVEKQNIQSAVMVDAVVNDDKTTALENGAENQTMEEQMETLAQLVADNPALAKELEQIKAEAFKSGKESVESRVKDASAIISADGYPSAIKNVALKCLAGEVSTDVLQGAVIAYDALTEKQKTDEAVKDSEEIGDTAAQAISIRDDGSVASDEEFEANLAALKALEGR